MEKNVTSFPPSPSDYAHYRHGSLDIFLTEEANAVFSDLTGSVKRSFGSLKNHALHNPAYARTNPFASEIQLLQAVQAVLFREKIPEVLDEDFNDHLKAYESLSDCPRCLSDTSVEAVKLEELRKVYEVFKSYAVSFGAIDSTIHRHSSTLFRELFEELFSGAESICLSHVFTSIIHREGTRSSLLNLLNSRERLLKNFSESAVVDYVAAARALEALYSTEPSLATNTLEEDLLVSVLWRDVAGKLQRRGE